MRDTNQDDGRAVTLGALRKLGITHLWILCLNLGCQHDALLDVSSYPACVEIRALRHHKKCEKCGGGNVDVRPYSCESEASGAILEARVAR
jgi:hypothetical protein